MKQKVLILGKGYIGNKLYKHISNVDGILCKCINQNQINYTNWFDLYSYICLRFKPDIIINASGYTGKPNVDACESNRETCWKYNVTLPTTLARLCDENDITLIHMGSGCIYEELYAAEDRNINEDTPPNFGLFDERSSWYSKSKHAAEIAIRSNIRNHYILRLRMPFDSDISDRNFLCKVLKYDKLIVYQNSMTCIDDLCMFTEKLIKGYKKIQPGTYNVCNTGHASIKDIVEIFKKHETVNQNWEYTRLESLNLQAGRSNVVLSTDKITKIGLSLPGLCESLDNNINKLCQNIKNTK